MNTLTRRCTSLVYLLNTLFIFNFLLIVYVLFRERKHYASTWAWILIITFVPVIGFFAYLLLGHDMKKRKMFSKKEEEDHYMHLIHKQMHQVADHECSNPVMKLHLIGHEVLLTKANNVDFFSDGYDKFEDLFTLINQATDYIHLEYYIIHNDNLGKQFKNLLIKKAKDGVCVRLLYDSMGCIRTSSSFFNELRAEGVQVACFFPTPIPYVTLRLNYRNHRKLCIIDGKAAYLGGFNVGDEYLGESKKMGYWRDTHLKVSGAAVALANMQFLLDWRFATKECLAINNYLTQPALFQDTTGIPLQLVTSGPDSRYSSIHNGYIKMIYAATTSIYIQTPYFIPDEALLQALKSAALSGVDVRIMIPNKPDHLFVYWATYSYIGELLDCGVKCYTYEKGFLHAKTIIVDEQMASVGTANFDIRSFRLNFEINAFLYDSSVALRLVDLFFNDLKSSQELTLDLYKKRSLFIKVKEPIARLLSPIL